MEWLQPELAGEFETLLKLRNEVNEELENLRKEKQIGQSLEAAVRITGSPANPVFSVARKYQSWLPELFIVSQVSLQTEEPPADTLHVSVSKISGERCPRCWRWLPDLDAMPTGERICSRCNDAIRNLNENSER